ncbi:MAG: hypothetical protein M1826_000656 [Phylliscum demangeonii]|nr:MAG: hypothetical protein M1826_000656 [Phylliscum demangeonii]
MPLVSPSTPNKPVRRPFDPNPYTRDGIRVERYRVGGPALVQLPSRGWPLADDHPLRLAIVADGDGLRIQELLTAQDIRWVSIETLHLGARDDPRENVDLPPTLLIHAQWEATDDRVWKACLTIRQMLQHHGVGDGVVIEIIDPVAREPIQSLAARASDRVVTRWPVLAPQIVAIARTAGASAVELIERGKAAVASLRSEIEVAQSFFAAGKHDLGRVWASSGFRQNMARATLDWALIDVRPERQTSNKVREPATLKDRWNGNKIELADIEGVDRCLAPMTFLDSTVLQATS